ncbi:MAG: hypothetical protein ABIN89_15010 [Chitinophagaceae bacterium]
MSKIFFAIGCLLCSLTQHFSLKAQVGLQAGRHTIAIFLPLYLDSAFDASSEYRYGKNFPKFLNPGLEFYEGVQLAADSLSKTGTPLNVLIYDTRSEKNPISQILQRPEFNQVELIIGHVTYGEIRLLADVAHKKNIPFINTNNPNDGGVTNNSSLVLLNSTLRTHIQTIYKFLQRGYGTSPIVVFRRKGVQEDVLQKYFAEIENSTSSVSLKLKFVTLNNNFTPAQLKPYLDNNRVTMCIAGSLDEKFAKQLTVQLASLNTAYPVQVMGMPTWDVIINEFEKKEYRGVEIFYTTPFYNAKMDKASIAISNYFKNNLYSRPTDMAFRGYECLIHFGKLLVEKGANLSSSVGEKKYKVFTDFDIQPVFLNKQSPTLDYFENRKIYFVKMLDGLIKAVY